MSELIKRYLKYTVEGEKLCIYAYNNKKKKKILSSAEYPLKEISESELMNFRLHRSNIFILKRDGKYFYTEVKIERIPTSAQYAHKCGSCKRCYAKPEEQGGCTKVMEGPTSFCLRRGYSVEEALLQGQRLEKYPFVSEGIEYWGKNVFDVAFIVISCSRWDKE